MSNHKNLLCTYSQWRSGSPSELATLSWASPRSPHADSANASCTKWYSLPTSTRLEPLLMIDTVLINCQCSLKKRQEISAMILLTFFSRELLCWLQSSIPSCNGLPYTINQQRYWSYPPKYLYIFSIFCKFVKSANHIFFVLLTTK